MIIGLTFKVAPSVIPTPMTVSDHRIQVMMTLTRASQSESNIADDHIIDVFKWSSAAQPCHT
jgi:hypothetical protein